MSAQGRSGCGSILGRTQPLDLGLKVAFTASMSPSLPQRRQRTSTFPAGGPEEAASVSPLSLAAPTVAGKPPSATWLGMFRAALSSRSGRACGTSVMHTRTRPAAPPAPEPDPDSATPCTELQHTQRSARSPSCSSSCRCTRLAVCHPAVQECRKGPRRWPELCVSRCAQTGSGQGQ